MSIFTSNSFTSVVQKPGDTDLLTVRAPIKGDIENYFPEAKVGVNKETDYQYRSKAQRELVAKVLNNQGYRI